uniref:Uncharacterized protein n=1 Tax=Cyanidium caldarium TaxID=2771 RepID=Q9TM44_CYACA|nr:hypothetical protein JXY51_pgp004 [Cyanidium caldarium]AAF13023.1 unknown [Cyanidium caldarium]
MNNCLPKNKVFKILNFFKCIDPMCTDNLFKFPLYKLNKNKGKFTNKFYKNTKNKKYIDIWLIFYIYYHIYLRIGKNQTKDLQITKC